MAGYTDKSKVAISELLKSADKAIREGKLAQAFDYITKVFDIDSRNIYALAYRERILYLTEAASREQKEHEKVDLIPAGIKAPPPDAAKKTPVETPVKEHASLHHSHTIRKTPAAIEAYRALLSETWADGEVEDGEKSRIDMMRETFEISKAEHSEIEQDVRSHLYMEGIRTAWKKGVTSFDDIKKRYQITPQEHLAIESKIFQLMQSLQAKGTVLVIDDDPPFLHFVSDVIKESGYECFSATSGEEGLKLLDSIIPDIVICDINFSKPNMSGFAFYEKFRSIDRFLQVPFVFLSGLDQNIVIRTGKQMGADDYLTKPVDAELLIATIEGKLRRARELRNRLS